MHIKYIQSQSGNFWSYKLLLLFLAVASVILFSSCKHEKKVAANKDVYYTCSMHPQINEPKPGKCPVCGMTLIQVQKSKAPKSDELLLSEQQMQLGNILVDTIGKGVIGNETVLNATLNYDQQKLTSVSSRVMGRIDKLYHKNIGDYIKKGEPLIEVYSEELNNAKQEYLLALERRKLLDNSLIDFDQVVKSAKTKLMLWGMSEAQINLLIKNDKAKLTTTVFSNQSGYITDLNIQEGEYISEGGLIVQLADLSTLWAEAQIYTSQFSQINNNGTVTVQLPDIGKSINGRIEFVNPELSPDKRINLIRVTIPNQGNQLRPGMSAYVVLKGSQRNVLSLPVDAVIRDAKGATVWVQTGKNTFKNKMVTVGMESGDRIEITYGLSQGEAVVTRGAYLINSEFIFKRGASPMAGMKM
ncbi:MAG: efflux RND transporter periplasmic adaptor subunit [Bacteroidota bacterium]|nr:efflux RND transporter periplasmic adaptor subunit [Bacteroidota bacterium]